MSRPSLVLAALMTTALPAFADSPAQVVDTYANIAEATYGDSLTAARVLREALGTLVAQPSEETLAAARAAWIESRIPYQQSEAFRFGNPSVDDWEGRVNAWPLDEGLIDYVDAESYGESEENLLYTANVIANSQLTIGGAVLEACLMLGHKKGLLAKW